MDHDPNIFGFHKTQHNREVWFLSLFSKCMGSFPRSRWATFLSTFLSIFSFDKHASCNSNISTFSSVGETLIFRSMTWTTNRAMISGYDCTPVLFHTYKRDANEWIKLVAQFSSSISISACQSPDQGALFLIDCDLYWNRTINLFIEIYLLLGVQ